MTDDIYLDLYTENVKKHIYRAKAKLPKDFPLTTIEREIFGSMVPDTIIISISPEHFDWRTIEDRLSIVLVLERLKQLIREEGIRCLIEKSTPDQEQSGF